MNEKPTNSEKPGDKKSRRREAEEKAAKSWIREWGDALIFSFIAAAILRTFIFGSYRIPTPSMEKNLLVNDFLIVSNITYGPRTPMSLCIPFTDACVPGLKLPWFRIPGYRDVERFDNIVFNYPIEIKPISSKTNYIKRAVGIAGDTLQVIDKAVYINGEREIEHEGLQKFRLVTVKDRIRLSAAKVQNAGGEVVYALGPNQYIVNAVESVAEEMKTWTEVDSIGLFLTPEDQVVQGFRTRGFNFSKGFSNPDNIGPFVVPFKGQEVELNASNWHLYQDIVERYEGNKVQRTGDVFVINGETTNAYTIKQNYYFAMGDNRDNSEDSRYWGFVPKDHIIGKASYVWMSLENDRFFMPRFNRILKTIR